MDGFVVTAEGRMCSNRRGANLQKLQTDSSVVARNELEAWRGRPGAQGAAAEAQAVHGVRAARRAQAGRRGREAENCADEEAAAGGARVRAAAAAGRGLRWAALLYVCVCRPGV